MEMPPTLDFDAIKAMIENTSDPRDEWKDRPGFKIVSLDAWINLCRLANVPHVPAQRIACIPVEDLLAFDRNPETESLQALRTALASAQDRAYEKFGWQKAMLRWDMCASALIKSTMAEGDSGWRPEMARDLPIDDMRTFDLIYEYPGNEIPVLLRPWVTAEEANGYPIEYRVFVAYGQIVGISSYYPQRPLKLDETTEDDVRQAHAMTKRLTEALRPPLAFPGRTGRNWEAESISFTADFIRTKSDGLLFLEAGPPYGGGAHPCCMPVDPREWESAATSFCDGTPVILANAR